MEKTVKLNEAFHNFTQASKSLETYYARLSDKVQYLTQELERKNCQLRESKDYFQAVFQSIGEAIIVLDQHEKIAMINRAAEKLIGEDSDSVKGMMFNNLDFSLDVSSSGTKLTSKGRKYDIILSRSAVSGPEGSVRGHVILIKDITRIKELEQQNERNQRLISMGEMAAKIVHEIRSPLCSIELFSNMLSNDLKGSAHSEMADGISTGIKSLNNILTNMLLFAKPQKLSFKDIKIGEAVEESVRMLAPLIASRGIELSSNTTDAVISGDSELLKQVYMNILLNAVQSMPEGGTLKINMGRNGDFATIAVTDEGEGISSENIEKIFDPFFSTKDKGTGLGLAIAHKIMQSHNGYIKAFKNENKGSTFCIYLPGKEGMPECDNCELLCA